MQLPAPKTTRKREWFGWLRPAIAVPAMAALLVVLALDLFVVRPKLETTIARLEQPQVLASAYLSSGNTRGTNRPAITALRGSPFVLFIDVPGEGQPTPYVAELYGPSGGKEWSLQVPPQTVEAAHGTLPIRVSLKHDAAGMYVLVLRSSGTNGTEGPEVERYPFELQFQ